MWRKAVRSTSNYMQQNISPALSFAGLISKSCIRLVLCFLSGRNLVGQRLERLQVDLRHSDR